MEDKFIELNGLRFHYVDWKNNAALPLILIHGSASTSHSWDTFARAMQPSYHVLAFDQRGHGETEWAQDYSTIQMVDDLDAFVRILKLERIVLLGHSMGARNAYAYTASHPNVVEKLVIVDMGPEIELSGLQRVLSTVQAMIFDQIEEAYSHVRSENPKPPKDEQERQTYANLKRLEDGRWVWRHDPEFGSTTRPIIRPSPSVQWKMLSNIECPTLIVRGAESDILSYQTAERMAHEMPNAYLVEVSNSGHGVPCDNPSGFINAVIGFL